MARRVRGANDKGVGARGDRHAVPEVIAPHVHPDGGITVDGRGHYRIQVIIFPNAHTFGASGQIDDMTISKSGMENVGALGCMLGSTYTVTGGVTLVSSGVLSNDGDEIPFVWHHHASRDVDLQVVQFQ